jgi:hypothetical protein
VLDLGYRLREAPTAHSEGPEVSSNFKVNKAGMAKLQRDLEKQFSGGLQEARQLGCGDY